MAIESSKVKRMKMHGKSSRGGSRFGLFKILIIFLVLIPVGLYFVDAKIRDSFFDLQLARLYERLSRNTEAKQYYMKAYEASGKTNLKAYLKVAEMSDRLKQYSEALTITNNLLDTNPSEEMFLSDIYLEQGRASEGLETTDAALASYAKSTKVNPDNYFALIGLGRQYRIIGDYPKAIEYLEDAISTRRLRAPDAHYELGLTYLAQNNASDALDEFDYALNQLPSRELKQKAQEKKIEVVSNQQN